MEYEYWFRPDRGELPPWTPKDRPHHLFLRFARHACKDSRPVPGTFESESGKFWAKSIDDDPFPPSDIEWWCYAQYPPIPEENHDA